MQVGMFMHARKRETRTQDFEISVHTYRISAQRVYVQKEI